MDSMHEPNQNLPDITPPGEAPEAPLPEEYADLTAAEEAAIRRTWAREEILRRKVGSRAIPFHITPVSKTDNFVHTLEHLRVHYKSDNS